MSWLDSLEEIRKTDWSKAKLEERQAKAREVVNVSAYAAAAAAALPIPLADLALLVPVHTVMVMTVGHVFGRKLSGAEAKRVVLELGAVAGLTFAGRAAISALLKLLPPVGALLSIPATFALTWGLGRAAMAYFENPSLSREDLKKVFEDAVQEGKSLFSKEAFDRFRQKNADAKAPEVDQEDSGSERDESAESKRPASSEKPAAKPQPPPKKRTL
jgi:uncharacterized protein (DUF697 family)